ncbi:MAG: DMT family transporter, partial [Gemmobacter sp.]|nr:DMT family transporter [Gemmobacter sp.]
ANLTSVMQVMPLAVTLGAALFFREPLGWRRMTAICAGLAGVLVIIRPGTTGFDQWSLVALLSVCLVVGRDLSTRRLARSVPSVTVAFWAATSVTLLGLVLSTQQAWQPVPLKAAILIAAAAVFVVTGYLFIIMVMRVGDIGFTAPFRYTALIWAVILAALVFDEAPDVWTILGALIVVGSGLFTLYRERQLRLRGIL